MRDIEQFYNTQIEEMPMNVADLVRLPHCAVCARVARAAFASMFCALSVSHRIRHSNRIADPRTAPRPTITVSQDSFSGRHETCGRRQLGCVRFASHGIRGFGFARLPLRSFLRSFGFRSASMLCKVSVPSDVSLLRPQI
jgi:hypothetical protein